MIFNDFQSMNTKRSNSTVGGKLFQTVMSCGNAVLYSVTETMRIVLLVRMYMK